MGVGGGGGVPLIPLPMEMERNNCEIAPEDILPTSKIQAEENNLWRIIHVTVRGYSALFIRLEFQGPSSPYSRPWRGLAHFANKNGTDTCTN